MARRSVRTTAIQLGWLAGQTAAWRRFRAATRDPVAAREARLRELLPVLGSTPMGRSRGLDGIRDAEAFQSRIAVGDYASHAAWIDRVAAGERRAMVDEPVEMLERTGGSGGANKLIPYTARLRAEFAEAVGVWMVDLHRHQPGLLGTRSYWSVSRATRAAEVSSGGLSIGFEDDAAYFGPVTRWALGRLMAGSSDLAKSPDIETWRRRTATVLLECADLGLVSVWSPSFLTNLMTWIVANADELTLSRDASTRLARACSGGELDARLLWPRLGLLSAWGDGFAATLVDDMRASFGDVPFQPKGVLATEGVVSFPLWGQEGHALAVTSHLIELRDLATGAVHWPEEVAVGAEVQPILTTGGGLVRYALADRLEVIGHTGGVPRVRLLGRLGGGSDLVGEKLTEADAAALIGELGCRGFAMLVPVEEPRGYALVVDGEAPDAARVEAILARGYHYAYARELQQLESARVVVRPDAWKRWESAIEAANLVLGEQKPGALEARLAVARGLLAD